ncbi:DUF4162 domain-containing protein, partial [Patescibacteria group bacterium]|nr:DUF4162 domain-containing protein [Patescibacteria group bacterium]
TTHYMEEAEYCNNIGIIDHGKMIAYNTPSALKRQVGGDIIKLKSENLEKLKNEIKDKFKIEVEQQKDTLLLTVDKGEEFLPKLLKGLDTHVKSVEFKEPNLDDVFISLTGRELRDEEASQHEKMASGMGPGRRHH